ncbi:MAG: hypothetical protein GW906_12025 [Epsilonproteobacteria bacterium]|nr:hypothetical protein [Campylobacterota bacterium]OIO13259.1 MAG: hypothetical protein AUJ81_11725 [Helicobacteraceae bacterium CG1_02_36_14]PIP09497.1 MAG: hypothetical protein COX50_10695 [Sulfurimonas sp. CG23_combo_of_CG06-09_8_20_14_all_36_33]PIS27027.1 MAG: hypothetical protein COT46_00340 [Sulfurimonas sp. CG08_land_8_20_14_0_20_36_33]PIU33813.1 MAG: hypothetical protein COT05_10480 [Sulfurimonas sp. CG07_land_8_20_14_0_80_36_56]PIV03363.1 MAG: hypothetical protein COS56_08675 [Sulfur
MDNRKESEIIDRISELTGKPKSTLYDWKKSEKNIKVYEALAEYVELKDSNINKDISNPDYLKKEIIKAINTLPNAKVRKFYHLMMAELAEMGH